MNYGDNNYKPNYHVFSTGYQRLIREMPCLERHLEQCSWTSGSSWTSCPSLTCSSLNRSSMTRSSMTCASSTCSCRYCWRQRTVQPAKKCVRFETPEPKKTWKKPSCETEGYKVVDLKFKSLSETEMRMKLSWLENRLLDHEEQMLIQKENFEFAMGRMEENYATKIDDLRQELGEYNNASIASIATTEELCEEESSAPTLSIPSGILSLLGEDGSWNNRASFNLVGEGGSQCSASYYWVYSIEHDQNLVPIKTRDPKISKVNVCYINDRFRNQNNGSVDEIQSQSSPKIDDPKSNNRYTTEEKLQYLNDYARRKKYNLSTFWKSILSDVRERVKTNDEIFLIRLPSDHRVLSELALSFFNLKEIVMKDYVSDHFVHNIDTMENFRKEL